MAPVQRTYRVPSMIAAKLVFELSRVGRRLEPVAGVIDQRERYAVGDAIVSVDQVEGFGWLCSIRGEEAAVDALAARLGLRESAVGSPSVGGPRSAWLASRGDRLLVIGLVSLAAAVVTELGWAIAALVLLLVVERWVWGRGASSPG